MQRPQKSAIVQQLQFISKQGLMKLELMTLIGEAWQLVAGKRHLMSWNLFLALIPLAMSLWLFHRPRARFLQWGTVFLLGLTFLPNIRRVWAYGTHLVRDLGIAYIGGVLSITLVLMVVDIWILHGRRERSLRWWMGFLVFITFLPNAPYVLTDVIHLIWSIRWVDSIWIITLVLIPLYLLFMLVGFEAYVLSLINLGYYLQRQGWKKFIWPTELIIHALCAIGIYLGRFIRLNSWDIITNPDGLVMSVMTDLIGKRPVLVMAVTFVIISSLYWLMKQVSLGIVQRYSATAPGTESLSKVPTPDGSVSHSDSSTAQF